MPRRVSRRKLRGLLGTGVDVEFGKKLVGFEAHDGGGVKVIFDDRSVATGQVLVGCDGSRSRVRELVVGDEASRLSETDFTMMNFPYSYTAEQAQLLRTIHPTWKASYHPDLPVCYLLTALDIQDPAEPTRWRFQNFFGWQGPPYAQDLNDPADRMRYFKSRGAQHAEPWRTAALAVADDTILPIDRGQYLIPTAVTKRVNDDGGERRLVTLAGHAAHPMLPHRGQGLNHALQDAAMLTEELKAVYRKEKTLEVAIAAYEEEMRERAGWRSRFR